jgi:O-antigen biosynthesis protein
LLSWPRTPESALAEINEFLSNDLRHYQASDSDMQVHPAVGDLVREAYSALLKLAGDTSRISAEHALDEVRARFDSATTIFDRAMFDFENECHRARAEHAACLAAHKEESARLAAEQENSARLAAERNDLTVRLASEQENSARLTAERDRIIATSAAARNALLSRLQTAIDESRSLASCLEKGDRDRARLEGIIRYVADRYARKGTGAKAININGVFAWTRSRLAMPHPSRMSLKVIRSSVYFDEGYYLKRNPDVLAAGMDPSIHYLLHGAAEGRDPGPIFSTSVYLACNPDVAHSTMNPLVHYETYGRREGRTASFISDEG